MNNDGGDFVEAVKHQAVSPRDNSYRYRPGAQSERKLRSETRNTSGVVWRKDPVMEHESEKINLTSART